MKLTKIIMGMPVSVNVVDKHVKKEDLEKIFAYFKSVDQKFSTYKKDSEIQRINQGQLKLNRASDETKYIFKLADKVRQETHGYFNIFYQGKYDPSGIVKGWAILQAAKLLKKSGFSNFYVEAGGDIEVSGKNEKGQCWTVGIKNPFNQTEIVKVVKLSNQGIATSGNYIRGDHIYNPKDGQKVDEIVSLTVIGPNVLQADCFATAAFAMGKKGIEFIERQKGLEGYMIDKKGIATYTSGFKKYETS